MLWCNAYNSELNLGQRVSFKAMFTTTMVLPLSLIQLNWLFNLIQLKGVHIAILSLLATQYTSIQLCYQNIVDFTYLIKSYHWINNNIILKRNTFQYSLKHMLKLFKQCVTVSAHVWISCKYGMCQVFGFTFILVYVLHNTVI